MIEVVTNDKERVAKWAAPQIDRSIRWDQFQAFGFVSDGNLIGAVVFTEWTGADIHVSAVSTNPKWLSRKHLKILHDYAFNQCGCLRISALVKDSNHKSKKLCEATGFKEEGRLRNYFKTEDGIVYGQIKEECKWLER